MTFKEAFEHDKALDEKGDNKTHRILFHASYIEADCEQCNKLKSNA